MPDLTCPSCGRSVTFLCEYYSWRKRRWAKRCTECDLEAFDAGMSTALMLGGAVAVAVCIWLETWR